MDDMGGMKKFMWTMMIVMAVSLAIMGAWNSMPVVKDNVHAVLDPSLGALLNWHLTVGMLIIVLIISFLMTLIQKYTTDQEALRELKKEQKILQKEMKEFRDNPTKILELQKKQFAFIPKTMQYTSRSIIYTAIPFIFLFRWFMDTFTALGDPKFFGFISWFWFYLIFIMIFTPIMKKLLKSV